MLLVLSPFRLANSWSVASDASFFCCWQVGRKLLKKWCGCSISIATYSNPQKDAQQAQSTLKVNLFFIVRGITTFGCVWKYMGETHWIYRIYRSIIMSQFKKCPTLAGAIPLCYLGIGAHGCWQVDGSLNLHAAALELALPLEDATLLGRQMWLRGFVKFGL